MTIASHCVSLVREHGPLTAEELGAACLEAGVTASRTPDRSVISALSWNHDGRALRVGDRFHAVSELLEGRWLTFGQPAEEPGVLWPDVDLACLTGQVEHEGLALAGGGIVKARRHYREAWTGPDGWLPDGEILGLRLTGGTASLRAVVIDEAAERRGERLVELLTAGNRNRRYGHFERHTAASRGLLALLVEDDELLREPVPPLSSLLPAPPEKLRESSWDVAPPFWATVQVHLPPELHGHLDQVARATGARLEHWLADQLAWVADSPLLYTVVRAMELREYDRGGGYVDDGRNYGPDDHGDPAWDASPSVLPFARPRGGDLGAS